MIENTVIPPGAPQIRLGSEQVVDLVLYGTCLAGDWVVALEKGAAEALGEAVDRARAMGETLRAAQALATEHRR